MSISIESPADFHVHLRQGYISELIVPHVRKGGFDLAYVMVISLPSIYSMDRIDRFPAQPQATYHEHPSCSEV